MMIARIVRSTAPQLAPLLTTFLRKREGANPQPFARAGVLQGWGAASRITVRRGTRVWGPSENRNLMEEC